MATHLETGRLGEDYAVDHLVTKGYHILYRNYRFRHAEIDIIAKKGRVLVFFEVKTRRGTSFGMPESFVDATKIRLIRKTAEHFIFEHDWADDIRFDIISVVIPAQAEPEIFHIEDAFF